MDIAPVIHRFRFPLFLLFAAANAAALYFVPQAEPLNLALSALGGFLAALARFRHAGLALVSTLAPLPGILWFGPSGYALCIAFAILMAAAWSDARLKEENPRSATLAIAPALAGPLIFSLLWSLHAPVQLPSLLGASGATLICLPLLLMTLGFGESAIARGNRQREALLRFSVLFARIAEPRWGLSLSGVGLVLAVLGYFQIAARPAPFDWLAAPVACLILAAATRDIRAGLAALAAAGLLLLFSGGVNGSLLIFLLFALALGQAWRGAGDSVELAWTRALEDHAATILFAGVAAMIAALPRGGVGAALHAGFGVIAALILFPAFTGALHRIFPRRRSVEELYRSSAS